MKKELTDTKDRMIKETVAKDTEMREMQAEKRMQKLCLLQEKGTTLIVFPYFKPGSGKISPNLQH